MFIKSRIIQFFDMLKNKKQIALNTCMVQINKQMSGNTAS
jgi:hypothetical protein